MLPCPFCGCEELEVIFDFHNSHVMCTNCKAAGPDAHGNIQAMNMWDDQVCADLKEENDDLKRIIYDLNVKINDLEEFNDQG
jgi:hypothetical protein